MWYFGIGLGVVAAVLAAIDLILTIRRRRSVGPTGASVPAEVVPARRPVSA
jgi:hypothetical protein